MPECCNPPHLRPSYPWIELYLDFCASSFCLEVIFTLQVALKRELRPATPVVKAVPSILCHSRDHVWSRGVPCIPSYPYFVTLRSHWVYIDVHFPTWYFLAHFHTIVHQYLCTGINDLVSILDHPRRPRTKCTRHRRTILTGIQTRARRPW